MPLFVFMMIICVCEAPYVSHNIAMLKNVERICEFMTSHIHLSGTDNTDLVVVHANTMLKQIWSREISPYGPNDDDDWAPGACFMCARNLIDSLQKMCCLSAYLDSLNKKVNGCLSELVRNARGVDSKVIITLQVGYDKLYELENLIRTGREFASKIIYSPSYEFDEVFFEWLIESSASPTAYTMVEDICIATITLGPWDKKVMEVLLQERFFGKLIFDTAKGTPYWQMNIPFPTQQRKVVIQLCQWSEYSMLPQKMRITLKKVEEETLISRGEGLINDGVTALKGGKDVCF